MSIHTFSLPREAQEVEAYLATQVKQGRSKSEVLQTALRLLMEREQGQENEWRQVEDKLDRILEILSREERR